MREAGAASLGSAHADLIAEVRGRERAWVGTTPCGGLSPSSSLSLLAAVRARERACVCVGTRLCNGPPPLFLSLPDCFSSPSP